MATAKEATRRMLDELPEDCSYEEIQHRLYVRQKIEAALGEEREGRVVDHQEARIRLARWLEP